MTFDWTEWGPPLMVMLVAGLGGGFLALTLRRDDDDAKSIGDSARREDLIRRQEEALEALAALETQESQMLPEDYEAERRALLQKGAAAMRELDEGQRAPTPLQQGQLTARQQAAIAAMSAVNSPGTTPAGADLSDNETSGADAALSSGIAELTGALTRGEIDEKAFAMAVAALSSATAAPATAAPATAPTQSRPAPSSSAPQANPPARKPPLISPVWQGAIYVIVGGLVIGGLLFWANSQSVERREGASMTGNQDLGGPPPSMPAGMQQRVAAAEARLEANAADVGALNELTSLYLREPQRAYGYNQKALEAEPTNVDAMMFDAIITAMMSMPDKAQDKLDAILEANPNHGPSWAYKGLLLAESKKWDEAEVALLKAKELGIQDHTLEQALKISQADGVMPEGTPLPGRPAPAAAGGATIISGTINIDPSRANFKASDLYVSVKDPSMPGPPLAAKKLPPGPFPISFVVTEADRPAMGGPMGNRPIPANFMVTVRLDKDGNAMTKEDGEPQVTLPSTMGSKLDLTLK